jgi:hypothetical protein
VEKNATAPKPSLGRRILGFLADGILRIVLLVLAALATTALALGNFPGHEIAAVAFAIGALYVQVRVKPWWMRAAVTLAGFALVAWWFAGVEASNEGNWQVDVSRPPRVVIDGDKVAVRSVRTFDWTSADAADKPTWEERTYDLSKLDSAWLALSYWDGNRDICHTMLSFGFSDGRYLAASVETRKQVGQEYSAWRGFFKQFALIYVLADERDVFRVRTNKRAEDMYLYRLRLSPEDRRRVAEKILRETENVSANAAWYGGIRRNCTTALTADLHEALNVSPPFSMKRFLNGHIDELAYENGSIANDKPFDEIRAASRITDVAKAADADPDFSKRIRAALPVPSDPAKR